MQQIAPSVASDAARAAVQPCCSLEGRVRSDRTQRVCCCIGRRERVRLHSLRAGTRRAAVRRPCPARCAVRSDLRPRLWASRRPPRRPRGRPIGDGAFPVGPPLASRATAVACSRPIRSPSAQAAQNASGVSRARIAAASCSNAGSSRRKRRRCVTAAARRGGAEEAGGVVRVPALAQDGGQPLQAVRDAGRAPTSALGHTGEGVPQPGGRLLHLALQVGDPAQVGGPPQVLAGELGGAARPPRRCARGGRAPWGSPPACGRRGSGRAGRGRAPGRPPRPRPRRGSPGWPRPRPRRPRRASGRCRARRGPPVGVSPASRQRATLVSRLTRDSP